MIKLGTDQEILQNFRKSYCDVWDETGFYKNNSHDDEIKSTTEPVTEHETTKLPETTESKALTSASEEFTTDLSENNNTKMLSLSLSLLFVCLLATLFVNKISF